MSREGSESQSWNWLWPNSDPGTKNYNFWSLSGIIRERRERGRPLYSRRQTTHFSFLGRFGSNLAKSLWDMSSASQHVVQS